MLQKRQKKEHFFITHISKHLLKSHNEKLAPYELYIKI